MNNIEAIKPDITIVGKATSKRLLNDVALSTDHNMKAANRH